MSRLVERFTECNEVVVLDNLSTGLHNQVSASVEFICGDIRDHETTQQAMTDVEVVFRGAAMVSVSQLVKNSKGTRDVNVTEQ